MKRTTLILLLLTALAVGMIVVGGVAMWWWRQRPAPASAAPVGFVSSDRLSISAHVGAGPWDADSPLAFRVTLLRPPEAATTWSARRPWWNGLTLHRRVGERESPVEFELVAPRQGPAADDEVQYATLSVPAKGLPTGPVLLRVRLERAEGDPLVSEDLRASVQPGVRGPRDRALAEARAHLGAGRFEEALAVLASVGPPDTADVQMLRADALAGVGRVDEAIDLLYTVLAQVPADQEEPPLKARHRLRELEGR